MLRRVSLLIVLCAQFLGPSARILPTLGAVIGDHLPSQICSRAGDTAHPSSPGVPCGQCESCFLCKAGCADLPPIDVSSRATEFDAPAARLNDGGSRYCFVRGSRLDPHRARAPPA